MVSQSDIGIAFRAAKRSFDIAASVVGMVVLSPLLLATAIAVKFTSQGPVIFKQKRYGKDEVPFTCYKFRTMKIDTPPNVPTRVMREDKAVMTPIGAMLRKTSIDELPQFVNIVKGDIPLRILKMRQVFSKKKLDAFALPANEVRTNSTAFSQVSSLKFVGLRALRCVPSHSTVTFDTSSQFLAKRVFRVLEGRLNNLYEVVMVA